MRELTDIERLRLRRSARIIIAEEIYDWNVGFFLKNGYKVAGELPDLPKGHSYYVVDKDI